ncbi:DUF3800 domain-containing protein [Leifsonia shinshuensis]|uniref:DUF3800 domain-containing protein n=1 Tax=Leifsonia shinshuensis TaxID=150026 RepID=A0A853CRS5_9MICO|nr:hypothetical protein [Leifsonia shinshuensis]
MHLCYVDDSGDPSRGKLLTALLIRDVDWSHVLDAWLTGREELHRLFGVHKRRELHANKLFKGRGQFCDSPEQEAAFTGSSRATAARIALSHLSKRSSFELVTVGAAERSPHVMYARFIAWLEDWAALRDTRVMIFYDGQHGLDETGTLDAKERHELWERALRASGPYRDVHRSLELSTRRIVEDVVMQDSRYSQLIQAADLIAYGAYHKHRQTNPDVWGGSFQPSHAAIAAYMQTSAHWPADSDDGVHWLSPTQEPPA